MLPIILQAAFRSAVLIVAVWFGMKALRIRNPHILMAAWQMVLVTSLLMPFLIGRATLTLTSAAPPLLRTLSSEPVPLFAPALKQALPEAQSWIIDWGTVCSAIYFFVAGLLILRLLIGTALTWRLYWLALPVHEDWTAGRDMRASASFNAPVTFGSTMLLPVSYTNWDATERRAVMAHEWSHVRRGDFYVLMLSSMNTAAFWFSPLAWWLNTRLANLAEARSDAAAIEDINDRLRYAEILLDLGRKASRSTSRWRWQDPRQFAIAWSAF